VGQPLLVGVLVGAATILTFIGVWRALGARDPVESRLLEYGGATPVDAPDDDDPRSRRRRSLTRLSRFLAGFGMGPRVAKQLSQADVPLTAAEYTMVMFLAAVGGFVIGTLRMSALMGVLLAVPFGYAPLLYLRYRVGRRQRAFTEQLPDVLTLLVGGLRAGYGLAQSIDMITDQLPAPASSEFRRAMRAVSLGLPIQQALNEMSERIGTDDADLVVTAINVQYEMGGNLAQTLEVIGETVRDRIRLMREIQVLTAQQRLTGYILAALPIAVGFGIFLINPEYIMRLFQPGWIRILPVAAVVMQIIGFLIIRRIVDIDV
jgi:tight adherence protein B